jgi:hypothetical protein
MIDEYNLLEGDEEFIDGSMELGTESPLEMNENKNVTKMNESQFRNLVYEMTLKMLDEQLNEDDPMAAGAAGAAPMDQTMAGGATMDPTAAGGAPIPQAPDADTEGLPGKYRGYSDKFMAMKAQEIGDKSGGAPGFSPQGPDDDKKKELAKQVAESVLRQLKKEFGKKK